MTFCLVCIFRRTLLCKTSKVVPYCLHAQLHWLPIFDRIKYKLSCIRYNAATAFIPQYRAEHLQTYTPPPRLRSAADARKFQIPLFKKKKKKEKEKERYSCQRSFCYQGPVTWNNSPFSVGYSETYTSFRSLQKTYCPKSSSNHKLFTSAVPVYLPCKQLFISVLLSLFCFLFVCLFFAGVCS